MASMWPPKKNTAFTLSFTLYKSDGTVVANPGTYTKKVSIDGGDVADIAAAVTEENTTYGQLSLVLSTDEMNGDWIWVYITDDTAGTVPFTCTLYTAAQTLDEVYTRLGAPAGASVSADVAAVKSDSAAILTDTGTTLDALIKDVPTVAEFEARSLAAADYTVVSDLPAAAPTVGAIADQVWDEALSGHTTGGSAGAVLSALSAGTGAGAITWTYTVTNSITGLPLDDVSVWVTTDSVGQNTIASGVTNALGVVTFYLDAGTVYVWRARSGYNFTNPDTEVVS